MAFYLSPTCSDEHSNPLYQLDVSKLTVTEDPDGNLVANVGAEEASRDEFSWYKPRWGFASAYCKQEKARNDFRRRKNGYITFFILRYFSCTAASTASPTTRPPASSWPTATTSWVTLRSVR